MQTVEKQGKSTSIIISDFMKETNLKLDDFKFEVIEEGSRGFLGIIGTKPTKILFTLPDLSERIKEFTADILAKINAEYKSLNVTFKDNVYHVKIISRGDPGYLIGKEAKMLDSIQHILNQMINKQEKKQIKLKIDVDDYRIRRKDALLERTKNLAEKVKTSGKSITMEPMHAANRRIVHQFIEKNKALRTMTIGEGEMKRIAIIPTEKGNNFKPPQKKHQRRINKPRSKKTTPQK